MSKTAYQRALKRLAHFSGGRPDQNSTEDAEFQPLLLSVKRYDEEHVELHRCTRLQRSRVCGRDCRVLRCSDPASARTTFSSASLS